MFPEEGRRRRLENLIFTKEDKERPETMTNGQFDKIVDLLIGILRELEKMNKKMASRRRMDKSGGKR